MKEDHSRPKVEAPQFIVTEKKDDGYWGVLQDTIHGPMNREDADARVRTIAAEARSSCVVIVAEVVRVSRVTIETTRTRTTTDERFPPEQAA